MMPLPVLVSRFTAVCVAAFCANAVWAAILPNASGRVAGAAGAVIAAALGFSGRAVPAFRDRLVTGPPAFLQRRSTIAAVLLPFLIPGLFLWSTPLLAFWRFDSRAALLVAWLMALTIAITLEHRREDRAPGVSTTWLLALFILFSAGMWLTVVLDSGVASFMVSVDRRGPRPCQSDALTTMIGVWESNPPSEHLFLGWRGQEQFDRRIVYANHVHPYLLTMYAWIGGVRYASGLPLWAATNTSILLPVLVLVAAFGTLLARSNLLADRTHLTGLLTLFLATGLLLTSWRLWIDLVRFGSDNPYPLLSAVFILVYALLLPPIRTRAAALAAAAFVALSPVHTPMLLLPVICIFGERGRTLRELLERNRAVATVCGVALLTGMIAYMEPRWLIAWKGYEPEESSFLFRSGLDGDTSYFSSLLQAAVRPCPVNCCYPRTFSDLVFPAVLPLLVFGAVAWRTGGASARALALGLLFLTTPYLTSLILFPQSVSVHPYLYDHLLVIPLVVMGLLAMLSAPFGRRLTGAGLLAFLLFVSALLMSNLLAISQGLSQALAYFRS